MKALIAAKSDVQLKTRESLTGEKKWYVLTVENEQDLMSGLDSENPELLVLDTESFNVAEVFDQVNLLERATKVLFLLDNQVPDSTENIRTFLRPGISDYLTKPFDEELLRHRIFSLISASFLNTDTKTKQNLLPELHDRKTGRLDAKKIADVLGISLKALSAALDKNYRALHKTPHSEKIQKELAVYKRIIEVLYELFQKPEDIHIWLNSPSVDFGGKTPLNLITEGYAEAVLDLVKDVQEGSAG
ncbi:MAG: DUF2384 domain-containing protein [Candidatus Cyclonatronum sp.]|uniref:antitoxin Xre/MbcA/ParS toxin-binding domain-containing protein n=1 Tax=Cyclonatronum sp. TaxID=3024185 RepID=UPI0025BA57A2|nr:antitoxin Xre/MbcA/ParS toxin-binding domain-containing protein [Cyclonatronum sp.]MCH8488283.1 DUF2384 domain-containing protein [Cyclonatronum sp.]